MAKRSTNSEARQRIVNTALDLFYRQGYLATGINQVIAEAEVSKNTFYYYFPSKEDLCIAYLQERHKIWMGWLEEKTDQYSSPYERVMSLFEFLEEWLTGCSFRGCAFLNIATEVPDLTHRIRKEVISHKNALRQVMKRLLNDLKQSGGEYSHIDVDSLTDMLYVLFEGSISSSQNYGDARLINTARMNFLNILKNKH